MSLNAIECFAKLIAESPSSADQGHLHTARTAFIDTVSCMAAGAHKPVTHSCINALARWGSGQSVVIGHLQQMNPPFAALINAAAGHALDFDDYDLAANAHPSVVIYPALLAMAAESPVSGAQLLDAYIVGLEIMQRLGQAMNMDHYRKGWLTTLTLGSIAAAGACARLGKFDRIKAETALSLSSSMASGLINQGGFTAKQLHPGIAAKNGVMAAALTTGGISASNQAIDGPIGIARSMGNYDPLKFELALSSIAKPWSIEQFALLFKAYPSCGYTHRIIDAAIAIHHQQSGKMGPIDSITISIPDYYLDLLVYANPQNAEEAMFSAEYSVAFALIYGKFDFAALESAMTSDVDLRALTSKSSVTTRVTPDPDKLYCPDDPDSVTVYFSDGTNNSSRIGCALGSPANPMSESRHRQKYDDCCHNLWGLEQRNKLWKTMIDIEHVPDLNCVLDLLKVQA